MNEFVSRSKQQTGGNHFILAYDDANFGLTVKGIDGGGSTHKRLMMQLSKKVRVIMTDEYRTSKACPVCRVYDLKMECPKGNDDKYNYFSHRFKN